MLHETFLKYFGEIYPEGTPALICSSLIFTYHSIKESFFFLFAFLKYCIVTMVIGMFERQILLLKMYMKILYMKKFVNYVQTAVLLKKMRNVANEICLNE